MILESLDLSVAEFEARSGWALRPEGACRGDLCIPLPGGAIDGGAVDVRAIGDALGMPIVHDTRHDLYAVGPASGGKVLESADCPEIRLPDLDGKEFSISSLRGRKVVMIAWASW